jgi:hypothetical protein
MSRLMPESGGLNIKIETRPTRKIIVLLHGMCFGMQVLICSATLSSAIVDMPELVPYITLIIYSYIGLIAPILGFIVFKRV